MIFGCGRKIYLGTLAVANMYSSRFFENQGCDLVVGDEPWPLFPIGPHREPTPFYGTNHQVTIMTKIDPQHPTIRESTATYKDRPIIVEMHSSYLVFRVKGMRSIRGMMSIDGALHRSLRSQVEADRQEATAGKPRKRQKLSLVKKS